MAKTKTVVTTASVAALEGVFILSGDVASCSDGTDGSCSNQREYRSFTPWYAAPSWSRARYLCACSASPKDFSKVSVLQFRIYTRTPCLFAFVPGEVRTLWRRDGSTGATASPSLHLYISGFNNGWVVPP